MSACTINNSQVVVIGESLGVKCGAFLCPRLPRLFPSSGLWMRVWVWVEWRLFVGLTNFPRGPRGLPIAFGVF
eukprot:scaffold16367_cov124-Isochrysis_galbana.AAC.3